MNFEVVKFYVFQNCYYSLHYSITNSDSMVDFSNLVFLHQLRTPDFTMFTFRNF